MTGTTWAWVPAALLCVGAVASIGGVRQQANLPLRVPLESTVPAILDGRGSSTVKVSEAEQRVAGMDDYVMRVYGQTATAYAFSVYVGYYRQQYQGHTIHSPKNCLPGAGWEALSSSEETITTPAGAVPVNRYLLQNGKQRALVLYWYQGRGRVAANEYRVKWDLLRDQATRGRSDEALVRVIVPVTGDEDVAYRQAVRVARTLVPSVFRAMPA